MFSRTILFNFMLLALIVAMAAAQDNATAADEPMAMNETDTTEAPAAGGASSAGTLRVAFALACSAMMMLKL